MGSSLCCCQSRSDVQFDEMELNEIPNRSPNDRSDLPPQHTPQFAMDTMTSYDGDEQSMIMPLCDEQSLELCPTTLRVITALSLYHEFVNEYDAMSINNDNLLSLIERTMGDEYCLSMLREDLVHIQTYHESNSKYMMLIYMKLIELNHEHDVLDLSGITSAIESDQERRKYFGHKHLDEIAMIQLLNQIHADLTNPFYDESKSSKQKEESSTGQLQKEIQMEESYHSDSSELDLGAGAASSAMMRAVRNGLESPEMESSDDETDEEDVLNTVHEDVDKTGQHIGLSQRSPNKKRGKKKKRNKTRNGYQGTGAVPVQNSDLDSDKKDNRKIGRLKLKKPTKKSKGKTNLALVNKLSEELHTLAQEELRVEEKSRALRGSVDEEL